MHCSYTSGSLCRRQTPVRALPPSAQVVLWLLALACKPTNMYDMTLGGWEGFLCVRLLSNAHAACNLQNVSCAASHYSVVRSQPL